MSIIEQLVDDIQTEEKAAEMFFSVYSIPSYYQQEASPQ